MSRKSAASLSVAQATELDRRLTPPAELSAYEAQTWAAIVATKPATWFQADCAPILLAYCKHISIAATIDTQIAKFNPDQASEQDWSNYLKLLDARRKETSKLESAATKLRLTPQARYDEKTAHTAAKKVGDRPKKLWEQ